MVAYPLFSDQPVVSRRCQELGLVVPLASAPRAPVESHRLRGALRRLTDQRGTFATRLAEARSWELRTIDGRAAATDRILALADPAGRRIVARVSAGSGRVP